MGAHSLSRVQLFIINNLFIEGTTTEFKRRFEGPIIKSRDCYASNNDITRGREKVSEMSLLVNKCIIRRTSSILTHYLPVKTELVIH